jgi:uncharacterized protein
MNAMANLLADATSPYLLQHKDNPVDWRPWGEAAFAEARRRDVPVLLSVGYAACHWCHVMAHESFEDPVTAALMNDLFVCVKVDREERPDVDAVYMEATQSLTGSGGWPMTCFLTPDGAPFYCGTYFPRPHFQRLLTSVGEAWRTRRDEVLDAGQRIVEALAAPRSAGAGRPLDAGVLDAAAASVQSEYDAAHGGFGGAPKFPPSLVLEFLLRHRARTAADTALHVVEGTCEAMARGGMYDQLAGGFARYSVDAEWVVPHFEKMLYDNALLLRVYLHLWRETRSPLARRVAVETADFLLRDLRTAEGGFASALDADTGGVEGLTYVWTPDQLRDVLGEQDGRWAAELLGVAAAGTFEHGASTLQLRRDPAPADADRWASARARLAAVRAARPQPARDDKVVAAWNGLAIAALAETGVLLAEQSYVDAAVAAADLLLSVHLHGGRLRRTSRDGKVGENAGVLEDYADVAEGLLVLHQATGAGRWLTAAGELLDMVLARFADGNGGFFDTADDAEVLVRRPWDPTDGPTPCGPAAAAGALLTYGALTGAPAYREAADAALATLAPIAARFPRAAGWACAVAEAAVAGPLQIAVVTPAAAAGSAGAARVEEGTVAPSPGSPDAAAAKSADSVPGDRPTGAAAGSAGAVPGMGSPGAAAATSADSVPGDRPTGAAAGSAGAVPGMGSPGAVAARSAGPVPGGSPEAAVLERVARLGTSPGAVVVVGAPGAPGVPLLADRPLVGGRPAAYVCRGFVCDAPTTDAAALAAAVRVTAPPEAFAHG